jgi:predicted amidophosphoribosyltransferase
VPTVDELTDPYANFMLGPRGGPDVCDVCFTFTQGYARCYACAHMEQWCSVVAPISYSPRSGQLHHALAAYKRTTGAAAIRLQRDLAAVLWRYLRDHESCVGAAAGIDRFDLVTTVPSSDLARDADHPLRLIAGELVTPTRGRYERLLRRSTATVAGRDFSPEKYVVGRRLAGESVLLIDDTWTTGASVQSAAAALRGAGAARVAAVVVGRHVRPEFQDNERRLRAIPRPFAWSACAWHSAEPRGG